MNPPRPEPLPPLLADLARKTKGFMAVAEGEMLCGLARSALATFRLPMVEIGSYCGLSSIYLGHVAKEMDGLLYSIDHHRGSEENYPPFEYFDSSLIDPISTKMDTLPFFRRTIELADLEAVVVAVVGESTRIATGWDTPLSLLFIDGGHGPLPCWLDYLLWHEKLDRTYVCI